MCKLNKKSGLRRIDPCIRPLIKFLKNTRYITKASCCGHEKYPMTIIIWDELELGYYELLSDTKIPRTKRFYKKDKQGYYYIPELIKNG